MQYSFSEVERALANLHLIADGKRSAFANRLRHLQKQGFPPGTNTGRGRAASYLPEHVFLLGVVLELNECGFTPERAMRLIMSDLEHLAHGVVMANDHRGAEAILCNFPANGLLDLTDNPTDEDRHLSCVTLARALGEIQAMGSLTSAGFRVAFFSVSGLIHLLSDMICRTGADAEGDEFRDQLLAWAGSVIESSPMGELRARFEQDLADQRGNS